MIAFAGARRFNFRFTTQLLPLRSGTSRDLSRKSKPRIVEAPIDFSEYFNPVT